MFEKTKYNSHVRLFDSIEELIGQIEKTPAKNLKNQQSINRPDFIGRPFESLKDVFSAIREPWQEGLDTIEKMIGELESADIPRPKSNKRKPRFSEDNGDEIDFDRLRSGRDYWRSTCRTSSIGPQTKTIIIDVTTPGNVSHSNILWRGAAALAMTNILEDAGYRVELWIVNRCTKTFSDGMGSFTGICLKRPEDPLDIATLSTAISGWFYRTIMFRALSIGTKAPKKGLGICNYPGLLANEIDNQEPIIISGAFSYYSALSIAREALKQLTSPPPPPPEIETEPAVFPSYVPPAIPYKAPTAAERKASERAYKEYQAKYERENSIE